MTWRLLELLPYATHSKRKVEVCVCVCVLDERSPLFHILLIRFYTVEEKGKGGLGFDYKERKREKREGPGLASRPTARTTQPRVKALFFPTCFFFRSVLSLYGLAQHVISVCVCLSLSFLDLLSLFSRLASLLQSGRPFLTLSSR